jgi:hypothetical protein
LPVGSAKKLKVEDVRFDLPTIRLKKEPCELVLLSTYPPKKVFGFIYCEGLREDVFFSFHSLERNYLSG